MINLARDLSNAVVCSRVRELLEALSAAIRPLRSAARNCRGGPRKALGSPARRPGADPRSAGRGKAEVPGGASGVLVRDCKEADRLVTRTAPGVVSLVAELRGQLARPTWPICRGASGLL